MQKLTLLAFAAAAFVSCSAPTKYDLVSFADGMRYLIPSGQPPASWKDRAFNDTSWTPLAATPVGPIPAGGVVCVRRTFDLGPLFAEFHQFTLTVETTGHFTAWLNGVQIAAGEGHAAAQMLNVDPSTLVPSHNVLAVEVSPAAGATEIAVLPKLDAVPGTDHTGQIARGPWLVAPTKDGITIVWETDVPMASSAIVDGNPLDGGAGTNHKVRVTGLQASHAYGYHVESGTSRSGDATFSTAANPGQRVRFVVYGDNRTDGDAHRRVVEAIAAEGPDFLANTGDLVDASNAGEWQTFFNIEYSLLLHTPLYPTIGNHESDSGGAGRFAELFPIGDAANVGGLAYSFDYGDVHIAVLDSQVKLGEQATWLDADLTAAEARGMKHTFLVMHWGPLSSGTSIMHGINDDAHEQILPVAHRHNVDALFSGHDHFYERGQSGTLAYFVTGGGGAPLTAPGKIQETQKTASLHHYLVVDVAGATVTVSAHDTAGNVFDQTTITR